MGKKKKGFIDKKNAYTFHLVHRSQQDPLVADEEASQYVFKPTNRRAMEAQQRTLEEETDSTVPSDTQEDRIKEQKKYGIFFEDDYDYLQHLKERQAKVELVAVSQPKKDAHDQLTLPKGLFSSKEEEEVGMLNKAAPLVGPQLDWDPDIVAAMDEDFDYLDPHNQLEDDFITMATQGEFPTLGPQVYVEHSDIDDDISGHGLSGGVRAADRDHSSGGDVDGNDDSDHKSLSSDGMSETRSRFTDYSLSSSVQPRNEGLTLLDNRFEKFMEAYDEELVGALDELDVEDEGGNLTTNDERLLQLAMDDFQKNFTTPKELTEMDRMSGELPEDLDESTSSESDVDKIEVTGKPQFDCESVLSTYSNLYNHPTKITEPTSSNPKGHRRKRTDEVEHTKVGDKPLENPACDTALGRPKNETTEEKRARKQAVKQDKKVRRELKKTKKAVYKEEELRLSKQLLHTTPTTGVV